jgi:hypothetical protein
VPFPGTELHAAAIRDGRLSAEPWWLDPEFRFGQTPLRTEPLAAPELVAQCARARRNFYSWRSIAGRIANFRANASSPRRALMFASLNMMLRREVSEKAGIPLGSGDAAGVRKNPDPPKPR